MRPPAERPRPPSAELSLDDVRIQLEGRVELVERAIEARDRAREQLAGRDWWKSREWTALPPVSPELADALEQLQRRASDSQAVRDVLERWAALQRALDATAAHRAETLQLPKGAGFKELVALMSQDTFQYYPDVRFQDRDEIRVLPTLVSGFALVVAPFCWFLAGGPEEPAISLAVAGMVAWSALLLLFFIKKLPKCVTLTGDELVLDQERIRVADITEATIVEAEGRWLQVRVGRRVLKLGGKDFERLAKDLDVRRAKKG